MIIKRLRLENFGSHASSEITFTDGINAIIGENGTGKTTILEAIAYALFPDSMRSRQDMLIRSGTNRMSVELEFELNGRTYLVVRERSKTEKSSRAHLYELTDGKRKLLLRDPSKVSKQIEILLGIGKDSFLNAIYIRQGEIADLLEESPSKRREILGRLLGIDILEKIWNDLRDVINALDRKISSIEGEMQGLGDVYRMKKEVNEELSRLKSQLAEIAEREELARKDLASLREELVRIEELDRRYRELMKEASILEEQLVKLKEELERKESDISKIDEELSKLPELKALASRYETLSEAYEILTELNAARSKLRELEGKYQELSAYKREVSGLEHDKQEANRLEGEIRELEEISILLSGYREKLSYLEARVSELTRTMEQGREKANLILRDISKILMKEVTSAEEARRLIDREISSLEQAIEDIESKVATLREKKASLDERIRQRRQYLSELEGEIDKCPLCGSKLDELTLRRIRERISRELRLVENEKEGIEALIAQLSSKKGSLANKLMNLRSIEVKELDHAMNIIKSSEEGLEKLRRESQKLRSEIESMEPRLKELEVKKRRLRELRDVISRKEVILTRIRDLEQQLRSEESPDELKKKVEAMESRLKMLIGSLISLEEVRLEYKRSLEAVKELERIKEISKTREMLQSEIESLRREISNKEIKVREIQEEISQLGYSPDNLERLRKNITELEHELEEILTVKGNLSGEIKRLEDQLSQLKDKEEKLKELRKRKEKLELFKTKIEKVREVFSKDKGIQILIREKARPSIEEELNVIFGSFGFDYDSVELDKDFTPKLKKGNSIYPLDRISGGEKIALALALRLAIARYLMMSNIETFLLDEPTIHLDEERINTLVDSLSSLSVPQMIVVTHSPRFRDIASHSILVSKSGRVSAVQVLDEKQQVSD